METLIKKRQDSAHSRPAKKFSRPAAPAAGFKKRTSDRPAMDKKPGGAARPWSERKSEAPQAWSDKKKPWSSDRPAMDKKPEGAARPWSEEKPEAPRAAPDNNRPRLKDEEFLIYGRNACQSVFQKRPEDLLRVYFQEGRSSEFKDVKKWCSARKLPYRELDNDSLNKVAASVHHEGVVMVVRPMKLLPVRTLVRQGLPEGAVAVALDGVENPHNIGAIMRSAAYFGVAGLILEATEDQRVLSPSAVRMAEGGLENVPCYQAGDMPSALRDLRGEGLFVLGADINSSISIYDQPLRFPCVVVLGNEREGLSERARKRCDAIVHVPGSGNVESLNVSVAGGVILSELFRRRGKAAALADKKNGG